MKDLFVSVSFEKGTWFVHSYVRIYWCAEKFLVVNVDVCLGLMLTKKERSWVKRCKEDAMWKINLNW